MTHQVVLDTETTGLEHTKGHRVVEIACIELYKGEKTGRTFQTYLNPERELDEGASRVNGLTYEFLKDKPKFKDIYEEFFDFIIGSELIIHNAPFDLGFLNNEIFKKYSHPEGEGVSKNLRSYTIQSYCPIIDTRLIAKKLFPNERVSLDFLCDRYKVDRSDRQVHGAMIDCELLLGVFKHFNLSPTKFGKDFLSGYMNTTHKEDLIHRLCCRIVKEFVSQSEDEISPQPKDILIYLSKLIERSPHSSPYFDSVLDKIEEISKF